MNTNTGSTTGPAGRPGRLAALAGAVEELAAQDPDGRPDAARAAEVLALRRLLDRLEGHWLKELAGVDAQGPPGRARDSRSARPLAGCGTGSAWVLVGRPGRPDRPGPVPWPLTATAQALVGGSLLVAHAPVLASGTQHLPDHVTVAAEPVLVAAASRLDPPRLRRVLGHLRLVADPDGADDHPERRHARRRLWLASTFEGMVAIEGLLEPAAGQTLLAALAPWAGPAAAADPRSGGQRRADALAELAFRLEGAGSPRPVGCGRS